MIDVIYATHASYEQILCLKNGFFGPFSMVSTGIGCNLCS